MPVGLREDSCISFRSSQKQLVEARRGSGFTPWPSRRLSRSLSKLAEAEVLGLPVGLREDLHLFEKLAEAEGNSRSAKAVASLRSSQRFLVYPVAFAKALAFIFEARIGSGFTRWPSRRLLHLCSKFAEAAHRSSQRFWVYPFAFAEAFALLVEARRSKGFGLRRLASLFEACRSRRKCFPGSFLASKLLECLGSGSFLASKLLEWLRSGTLEAPEAAICEASCACAAAWKPLGAGSYVICEATLAGALDLRVGLHEDLSVSLRN